MIGRNSSKIFKVTGAIIAACMLFVSGWSQQANQWINYSQSYYRFAIVGNGIVRIPQSALVNAGIPINSGSFDPRNLQIFARGKQIPIYVEGENDGFFNASDFIEFYAEANNGWLDSALYENAAWHINKGVSLYNDTIFYYLTWNNSTSNLRYINETDVNFAGYTPLPYYIYEAYRSFRDFYYEGEIFTGGLLSPEYTAGEGYCRIFSNASNFTADWTASEFSGTNTTIYTGGPATTYKIATLTGSNPMITGPDHRHQVRVDNNVYIDQIIDGFTQQVYTFSVPSNLVASASNPFRLDFLSTYTPSTRNGLAEFTVRIPQVYNLGNRTRQTMYIPNGTGAKSLISITNFNALGTPVRLYDLTNRRRITAVNSNGTVQALLPNLGNERACYITSDALLQTVQILEPVSTNPNTYAKFTDYTNQLTDYNYLVVTSDRLMESGVAYKNYRNQTGYKALLLNMRELTDQFGYGVPMHPMAIRNFLRMALQTWTQKPEYLMILGKGIRSKEVRFFNTLYNQVIMPAIGDPATDNLYGFRLLGSPKQDVAVGRLAATTNAEVNAYLNKLQTYESNLPEPWMKNVLHLSGGKTQPEQQALAFYVNNYRSIIQDTSFGANVITFYKTNSLPVQITVADSIRNLVDNTGISLMTVFGHSSGQGFDQNVDEPENYQNTGKYPIILANSCLSGDLFQSSRLISERFVLTPNRGSIAFIASGSLALSSVINIFTDSLYRYFAKTHFGMPIGFDMRKAITVNTQTQPFSSILRFTALDIQLHGDPALRFRVPDKPDYVIEASDVSFEPAVVTSEKDSFKVRIVLRNIGKATMQNLSVGVRWDYPVTTAPDSLFSFTRPPVFLRDTFEFYLPVNIEKCFGDNYFTFTLDPNNTISEFSEFNNTVTVKLPISSADIIPVYPPQFAVIPQPKVTLSASTGDPFAPVRNYKFQLDTTDTFNSPFLRDTVISQSGGLVKWSQNLPLPDSTVYFWRTGVDSANTGNFYNWRESSFQFIAGKAGWGQDHFYQYKNNKMVYLEDNRNTRQFEFITTRKEISCFTRGCPSGATFFETKYSIDGIPQEEAGCQVTPGMYVAVIDPITLEPWGNRYNGANPNNFFGNANDNGSCRPRVELYFIFWMNDPAMRNGLRDLLNNLPNDHYVLAYTWNQGTFNNASYWTNDLISAFENLGADTLRTLVDSAWSRPYIFFGKKGDLSVAKESVGVSNCDVAYLQSELVTDWIYGTMETDLIGPAAQWGSLHWRNKSQEFPSNDSTFMQVFGVRNDGTEQEVLTRLNTSTTDIFQLNDSIDAQTYPYLRLRMFTRDDITQSPSQLQNWHVLYTGVPEIALNPNAGFSFLSDTLNQGQDLKVSIAVENISDLPMDSVTMRYYIVDQNNQVHNYYTKNDSLRPGQLFIDTFTVSSIAYPNLNQFWIEANPLNHPNYQKEQYHFNNIAQKTFTVGRDNINPLLDVTFDGMHIMNGDIVSAQPLILIQLKDENPLLVLNDTSDFEIYLKRPGSADPKRIFFNSDLTFYPGVLPENKAKIEFRPDFSNQDGTYQLLVRAKDRSNNISGKGDGDFDYKIDFEVISKSTITEVVNYPNPFSTSTQFVFTLTGSDVPDEFTIQILTISGVVVREITRNELGPIHIGRNITDFKWDGTDEYGDKLATGVYLYRVITKINGESLEKRNTAADKFFTNGFGKMYIIR